MTELSPLIVTYSVGVIHGGIIFLLMPQSGMSSPLNAMHLDASLCGSKEKVLIEQVRSVEAQCNKILFLCII